jgi:hypothetical protein
LKKEAKLHAKFSVSSNPHFYNKSQQTSTSFTTTGQVPVRDGDGNSFCVARDDPRLLSGELTYIWTGRKHSEEAKAKIGAKNSVYQKGKGNSQYGTMWIVHKGLKINKKLRKGAPIPEGWEKGRGFF